jgi:AcrR family transcriptional regulator
VWRQACLLPRGAAWIRFVPFRSESSGGSETRSRIIAAAFELFGAHGYDATTIDAVAERAGIARRTFFRYFRSKEDVIFPDHRHLLDTVQRHLQAMRGAPAIEAICGSVRLVFHSYLSEPDASVRRYHLTREVASLRNREIATARSYERALSGYLRDRFRTSFDDVDAALRASVLAGAVIAAHNAVLREWLRAEAGYDPLPALERALTWVAEIFHDLGGDGSLVT